MNSNRKDLYSIRLDTNRIYEYSKLARQPVQRACINLGREPETLAAAKHSVIAAEATLRFPRILSKISHVDDVYTITLYSVVNFHTPRSLWTLFFEDWVTFANFLPRNISQSPNRGLPRSNLIQLILVQPFLWCLLAYYSCRNSHIQRSSKAEKNLSTEVNGIFL